MTTQELIQELGTYAPDTIVVLSADGEGNRFEELQAVETYAYDADEKEIGLAALTPELEAQGYAEEDVMPKTRGVLACVLWP